MDYKGFTTNPKQRAVRMKHDPAVTTTTELLIATANGKVLKEQNEEGKTVDVVPGYTQEQAVETLEHLIDVKSASLVKAEKAKK